MNYYCSNVGLRLRYCIDDPPFCCPQGNYSSAIYSCQAQNGSTCTTNAGVGVSGVLFKFSARCYPFHWGQPVAELLAYHYCNQGGITIWTCGPTPLQHLCPVKSGHSGGTRCSGSPGALDFAVALVLARPLHLHLESRHEAAASSCRSARC